MFLAVRIIAPSDANGNPRRGYFVFDTNGAPLQFVEEGYEGTGALRMAGYANHRQILSLNVQPAVYAKAKKWKGGDLQGFVSMCRGGSCGRGVGDLGGFGGIKEERAAMWARRDAGEAAAKAGTAEYQIDSLSDGCAYLKLVGYGYVGKECAGKRIPMNLGYELPPAILAAAWDRAVQGAGWGGRVFRGVKIPYR